MTGPTHDPSPPSAMPAPAPRRPRFRRPRPPKSATVRWMFKALAVVCLGLGVLGAFLPVMPTVPFILLGAWAASRGSLRMSLWMEKHPQMGPMIRDWRAGGVVKRRAKWLASVMMAGGAVSMSVLVRPWWLPAIGIAVMIAIGIWLWQRPEQPPQ